MLIGSFELEPAAVILTPIRFSLRTGCSGWMGKTRCPASTSNYASRRWFTCVSTNISIPWGVRTFGDCRTMLRCDPALLSCESVSGKPLIWRFSGSTWSVTFSILF